MAWWLLEPETFSGLSRNGFQESNWFERFGKFVVECSRRPHICETGHSRSLMGGERLRNFKDEKRLRKVCKLVFSLLNMEIYDFFLSVSCLFLNALLTFLRTCLFFHVLIDFFEGSFSLMTKFLSGIGWIFFQLLRLLPKKGWDVRLSIDFSLFKLFSQLWTRLILLWILKVRPQFHNDKARIIARWCYTWAKSLCWFGGSALSAS